MRLLRDREGLTIRLTDERLGHILDHPEMVAMEAAIEETLAAADQIVQSRSDSQVRLYYRRYNETAVDDKLLCVVVKVLRDDAFVITAYLTDRTKRGTIL
ncbi:MAG: hypothetical protein Q7K03_00420 [Dehalococcoidia bacterium]|nr:hypothetical protein [Dehalococcoidia bacterium]